MNEALALEARNRAGGKFKVGLNCCEAIIQTFNEMLNNPMNTEALKIATGFGGGLGYAGCMCGALSGSVMTLGLLQGRHDPAQSRMPAYNLAHEFHDRFVNEYEVTCCRALNPYEYESKEHLRRCLKITGGTAKLLMEFLQEKKLIDEDYVFPDKA